MTAKSSNPTQEGTLSVPESAAGNPCLRQLTLEVPAETVQREVDGAVEKYRKNIQLPGFRRGKVPAGIIRQRFGADINHEVAEALIPRHFREEVERQGLHPISQPRVTDMHLHPGEPLRFTAEFEVMPEIEVQGYDDLRAERPDTAVTDEEVEQAIENLREQQATYDPVEEDRPLQDGDFAQVSFRGESKAAPAPEPPAEGTPAASPEFEPVEVNDVLVEIGGTNTVSEFSQNLRGARAGEQRIFDVTYADDFSDKRLAGRTVTYSVTVQSLKRKSVPALDDEFAKSAAGLQTLDELRANVRERIQEHKRREGDTHAKDQILGQLVERNDFPIPESMVDQAVDARLERGLRALAAQGMRTEDMRRLDFDRLRAGQREAARREVKASLILDRIADKENIDVSDEEVDREVEALAIQTQQTKEAILGRLTKEGALDRIRGKLRNEKTLDYLYSRSA